VNSAEKKPDRENRITVLGLMREFSGIRKKKGKRHPQTQSKNATKRQGDGPRLAKTRQEKEREKGAFIPRPPGLIIRQECLPQASQD